MDWLDHALRESPYICGAIACVVAFVSLRVVKSKPVRTTDHLVFCMFLWMVAAFKVMRFWPPTLVQSEILVGTILACFLLGLMHSRLGSITFDTTTHEFVIELSVLRSAVGALFAGVVVTLLSRSSNNFGDYSAFVAVGAWLTGGMLGQWRRIVRAGGA